MEIKEIEQEIVNFIECWYECEFKGQVKLEMPDKNTYYIRLILNQKERPLQITYEGTYENFCKFIKDEIRRRRLTDVQYFTGYRNEQRGNC